MTDKIEITLDNFIDSIPGNRFSTPHFLFIADCVKYFEREQLKTLFYMLWEKVNSTSKGRQLREFCRIICYCLENSKNYANTVMAIKLICYTHDDLDKWKAPLLRLAELGYKIATYQQPATIDKILGENLGLEIKAMILYEANVCKKITDDSSNALTLKSKLLKQNHPLGQLPLSLYDFEKDVMPYELQYCGDYGFNGKHIVNKELIYDTRARNYKYIINETSTPDRIKLIIAAIECWTKHPDTRIEARTFNITGGPIYSLKRFLHLLELACLGSGDKYSLEEYVKLPEIYALLYSAATEGGVATCKYFAAYGRLYAWWSLAGLVGCSKDDTMDEILENEADCHWAVFGSSNSWFCNHGEDFGIICSKPETGDVSILAATSK